MDAPSVKRSRHDSATAAGMGNAMCATSQRSTAALAATITQHMVARGLRTPHLRQTRNVSATHTVMNTSSRIEELGPIAAP